jgi:hypothetical protein
MRAAVRHKIPSNVMFGFINLPCTKSEWVVAIFLACSDEDAIATVVSTLKKAQKSRGESPCVYKRHTGFPNVSSKQ